MTRKGRRLKTKKVAPLHIPLNGDHGQTTAAQTNGTVVEEILNEKGENPNQMGRRRRVEQYLELNLTMRQQQAAKALRDAWCRKEMLSSGGELKEQVDSSPKPDAVIAHQVMAMSHWLWVSAKVRRSEMEIIEHVLAYNQPLRTLSHRPRRVAIFKDVMDRVADHLRY